MVFVPPFTAVSSMVGPGSFLGGSSYMPGVCLVCKPALSWLLIAPKGPHIIQEIIEESSFQGLLFSRPSRLLLREGVGGFGVFVGWTRGPWDPPCSGVERWSKHSGDHTNFTTARPKSKIANCPNLPECNCYGLQSKNCRRTITIRESNNMYL